MINLTYRPAIDGMRAIAVIGVVLYHAFPSIIPGGFAGVDVFFVISGYLITLIIQKSLKNNSFKFINFYERRVRRIFPSLIVVLIFSYIFGWIGMLDDEFKQLGKHIAGGATFVNNILLWQEAGYFDSAIETKPLMHLWSLGVEEQFYIIWPIIIFCYYAENYKLFRLSASIAIVSLLVCIILTFTYQSAAFYLPVTRFWEFMAGALVGFYKNELRIDSVSGNTGNSNIFFKKIRKMQTLPVLGLFLLIYGFLCIDSQTNYPGFWSLIPVAGAGILIGTPDESLVNKILGSRLLVYIGLISYPLYLWHWPLLSFARIIESQTPAVWIRVVALLLSLLFSWITYIYVEQPIRKGGRGMAKCFVMLIIMAAIFALGLVTYLENGFPSRFTR